MKDFINFILPYRCVNCERILNNNNSPLCVKCLQKLPYSHEKINIETLTAKPFLHHKILGGAACLLIYQHGNSVQKLIHANKYYNQPEIGTFLAKLAQLVINDLKVDVVTCIPTHKKTERSRGYNQVELFAKTIASDLNTEFNPNLIQRKKRKKSQTHKNRVERIKSLKNSFEVKDEIKNYQSILLLDDVLTTGSTINVCLSAVAEKTNATVNVFTMARVI